MQKVHMKFIAGVCAKCGSENLDYDNSEPLDNGIIYPYICLACDAEGEERYELVFIENIVNEEGE
jgi:hypothetical protein